jgi:hypothetical protein
MTVERDTIDKLFREKLFRNLLNSSEFQKKRKKFLTNETGFDIIDKLNSERALLKLDLRKKFEKVLDKENGL